MTDCMCHCKQKDVFRQNSRLTTTVPDTMLTYLGRHFTYLARHRQVPQAPTLKGEETPLQRYSMLGTVQ